MNNSNVTLSQAITQFDRSPTNPVAEGYRSQRAEILKRFPRDKWPEMRLDDYALGQPAVEDTYCRWLEYKSPRMGSIRGGSARKLIIYKRKEREGWYFPKALDSRRIRRGTRRESSGGAESLSGSSGGETHSTNRDGAARGSPPSVVQARA